MKTVMAHPVGAVLAAGAGVAIAVVITLLHRGSDRAATCRAALIPAYVPPRELAALARGHRRPRMVVVNPDSGPGAQRSAAYGGAVGALQAAGVRVLGYVATGYGGRDVAGTLADVDRYRSWYGVDGIFFDEAAADPAQLGYYRTLAQAARRGGARLIVLNPGVPPARGYFDVADVVVTFEGTFAAYGDALRAMPAWLHGERPDRVAHLVYGAGRGDALNVLADGSAGYLYATAGALPNPWRTLPGYLGDEVDALATCG